MLTRIKTFLEAIFYGTIGVILLIFWKRFREDTYAETKMISDLQKEALELKRNEAKNAVDKKFQGQSDRDVVLGAIEEKLRGQSGNGSSSESGSN